MTSKTICNQLMCSVNFVYFICIRSLVPSKENLDIPHPLPQILITVMDGIAINQSTCD